MPRVSVIIPCYNYAHFLPEAVESVIAQTYRDFEIIIVNDGSQDNTNEVAEGLRRKYPAACIALIDQRNSGVAHARNNGISAARGEFILPLDADDMLGPCYIERLVSALDSDPDTGFAYTWSEKFGLESGVLKHGSFTLKNILVRDGPPLTLLIRKSAWEKVGGYKRMAIQGGEDWEIGCSFFEAGFKGTVIPEVLFKYRKHGPSMIDDMVNDHAVLSSRDIKLLHPRMFEPLLSRISPSLAKAVIWIKYFTRDPVLHYIYVRHPGIHAKLRAIKYGLFVR